MTAQVRVRLMRKTRLTRQQNLKEDLRDKKTTETSVTVLWQKLHREKSVVRHLELHHDVSRKKVTVVFQILPLKCAQRKHILCASHEKGCLTENANIEISSLTRIRIMKPISCLFIASQICPSICSIW